MSHLIHQFALYLHISVGAMALIVFWLPMIATKGSKNHKFYGTLFVKGMYAVSMSGLLMSILVLIDPIAVRLPANEMGIEKTTDFILQNRIFAGFLLMLSVLVFSNVRQSIMVLKAKTDRSLLKTPFHIGLLMMLATLALIMATVGFEYDLLLFKIFAALSIVNSIGMLYYIFKPTIKQREWLLVHLGNILGAGMASYTAFFAFGGSRFLARFLTGNLTILPWVLPSIIGVTGLIYLTRKYRHQYNVV